MIPMQSSFSDLKYASKKKLTRRDRFLGQIEAVTPWAALEAQIAPHYPQGEGRGRRPIGRGRRLPSRPPASRDRAHRGPMALAMERGKRKALPKDALGQRLERFEKLKASIRAKVEHPFDVLEKLFGHRKTRYRGLATNEAQLFSLFGLVKLVLAHKKLMAPDGRGAS